MLSVASALKKLLKEFSAVTPEVVPLLQSRNRVLAEEFRAPFDLPLFTNSSMDGFAVISEDVKNAGEDHPIELSVIADIPAGSIAQKGINKGASNADHDGCRHPFRMRCGRTNRRH